MFSALDSIYPKKLFVLLLYLEFLLPSPVREFWPIIQSPFFPFMWSPRKFHLFLCSTYHLSDDKSQISACSPDHPPKFQPHPYNCLQDICIGSSKCVQDGTLHLAPKPSPCFPSLGKWHLHPYQSETSSSTSSTQSSMKFRQFYLPTIINKLKKRIPGELFTKIIIPCV